jgi:thiol:disulfide interchange protein
MHDFTVVVLLGLALWKVVDLIEDFVPFLTKFHNLVTIILGVAAAVALDYSMFGGLHVAVRAGWVGTWGTGLAIAGTTSAWRALLHWLGSNEGDAPEARHPIQHLRHKLAA